MLPSLITRYSMISTPGIFFGKWAIVTGSVWASFLQGIWMISFVIVYWDCSTESNMYPATAIIIQHARATMAAIFPIHFIESNTVHIHKNDSRQTRKIKNLFFLGVSRMMRYRSFSPPSKLLKTALPITIHRR